MERLLTLLNGTWKGTYTERRVPTSLTISATTSGSPGNEKIKLTGGGKDALGQFTIDGTANPSDKRFAYIKTFSGVFGGKWHHEGRMDLEGKKLVEGRVAPANNLNSTWGHFVFEKDITQDESRPAGSREEAEAARKTQKEEAMKKEQREEAARRKREENKTARKRREEEETARKKQEDEAAARKRREQEEAARKKREEQKAKVARQKEAARRREADAARQKQEEDNAKKNSKNSGIQIARRPGSNTPRNEPASDEAQQGKQGPRDTSNKAPQGEDANPPIIKSPTQGSELNPGGISNSNLLEPDDPHYFAIPAPHPFAPPTGPQTSLFTSTLGLVRAEHFESPSPPSGPEGLLSSIASSNDVLSQEYLGLLRPEQVANPPPLAFGGLLSSAQLTKSPPIFDGLLSDDILNQGLSPRPKQIRIL